MIKILKFTNKTNKEYNIKIKIENNYNDEFGSYLWDSTYELSNFIINNENLFKNKKIIELGCGLGICGIISAKLDSFVYLTDRFDSKDILINVYHNCELNNVIKSCKVVYLIKNRLVLHGELLQMNYLN